MPQIEPEIYPTMKFKNQKCSKIKLYIFHVKVPFKKILKTSIQHESQVTSKTKNKKL